MSRYVAVVLFLSFGAVFHLCHGIEVNVTDQGKLCLYANLKLNFSISYDVAENKSKTASFELPADATSSGSKCQVNSSLLTLDFGDGHSWSVMFSLDGKSYQGNVITFSYNLSDSKLFPEASSNKTITVTSKVGIKDVATDTCYSCKSEDLIQANNQVNMTLWDVLIQAFVKDGTKSENITSCVADLPTPPPTTPAPVTNTTTPTAAPVTNTTTAAPATTTPTPTLPPPIVGNYSLYSSQNTTACLLASFGLQIRFTQNEKYQEINFDPTNVSVSGSCGIDNSELVLESTHVNITFSFLNNTKKFLLHALNISVSTSSGVFKDSSANLTLWETSVGSSYMCNKELNNTITSQLSLFTTNLHVQPFGVKNGLFSTAHECSMDDPSILIPIIVGAALAGLILIVVIAYIVGRRKTYAGYQTL